MRLRRTYNRTKSIVLFLSLFVLSTLTYADTDPATSAASQMENILFGGLGTSLCSIILGATFVMAKTGKVSWDKFIFMGVCVAGFLGSPAIVTMIKGWI